MSGRTVKITRKRQFINFFRRSSKNNPITNTRIIIAPREFSNRRRRENGFVFRGRDFRNVSIWIGNNVTITGVANNRVSVGQGSALLYLNYNNIRTFWNVDGNNTIIQNLIFRCRKPNRARNTRTLRQPLFGKNVNFCFLKK